MWTVIGWLFGIFWGAPRFKILKNQKKMKLHLFCTYYVFAVSTYLKQLLRLFQLKKSMVKSHLGSQLQLLKQLLKLFLKDKYLMQEWNLWIEFNTSDNRHWSSFWKKHIIWRGVCIGILLKIGPTFFVEKTRKILSQTIHPEF